MAMIDRLFVMLIRQAEMNLSKLLTISFTSHMSLIPHHLNPNISHSPFRRTLSPTKGKTLSLQPNN